MFNDVLDLIAAHCDACTRESLSIAFRVTFPRFRLKADRYIELKIPEVREIHGNAVVWFYKACHNLHVKITRYSWCCYDYSFEKYVDGQMVYTTNYFTDPLHTIVVQFPTWCNAHGGEVCGCLLCARHLQKDDQHKIQEMRRRSHPWHPLKIKSCPVSLLKVVPHQGMAKYIEDHC